MFHVALVRAWQRLKRKEKIVRSKVFSLARMFQTFNVAMPHSESHTIVAFLVSKFVSFNAWH